jgi:hypothetical protein
MPEVQAILKEFPWGRTEKDGKFDYLINLALLSLLGDGPEFGWWTMQLPDLTSSLKKTITGRSVYLDTRRYIAVR